MAVSRPRRAVLALVLLAVIAAVVFVCDQLVKNWVVATLPEGVPVPVIGEVLQFTFVRNPGAAFSIASGSTWIFSIIAVAVIVVIIVFARRIRSFWWAVLFGMVLGGTLGNLFDRLFREPGFAVGHVVDFIQVIYFPAIFNVADIFIVSSAILFVLISVVLGIGLDGSRSRGGERDAAAAAAAPPASDAAAAESSPEDH